MAALYIFKCAIVINLKIPRRKEEISHQFFYHIQQYSFCDGASQGNPEPSGSRGFIILQNQKITFKRGAGIKTNNYVELLSKENFKSEI